MKGAKIMKYIEKSSNDPHYNLAFEEYILKYLDKDEDYILLWISKPSISIGKNQNTIEEINMDYVKKNNIHIVRRITGGGAVYHDLGTLNFSFIPKYDSLARIDFKKYNLPIIKSLQKLGIQCELSGRNDITINGKKFSGIAQSLWKGRILNHGTLLFDTKLDVLSKALNVKKDKIESKGIKSVKSRVTNIKPYLKKDIDIFTFREILLKNIFEMENKPIEKYELTEKEKRGIEKLVEKKYGTWEWNFGRSPKFNFKNHKRFPAGGIDVHLNVVEGKIKACKIYGDFFGAKDIGELERMLLGVKYDIDEVDKVLKDISIEKYFKNISKEDFLSCLFNN